MQQGFTEKIIYRLVRKHIAGPTMKSAIDKVKVLNSKGVSASVSFLSDNPTTRAKCDYITKVYMQLARELSRFVLKASIHLKLEQLGLNIDKDLALQNLNKVIDICNKKGIFVWCSVDGNIDIASSTRGSKGIGFAFDSIDEATRYLAGNKASMLKVKCRYNDEKAKHETEEDIKRIMLGARNVVLLSPNEGLIKHISKNAKYKKSLIFEFQLGYSDKKLSKLIKSGARISMYVPFGKDWMDYTMDNMPEGYMRRIVSGLLKEKASEESEVDNFD